MSTPPVKYREKDRDTSSPLLSVSSAASRAGSSVRQSETWMQPDRQGPSRQLEADLAHTLLAFCGCMRQLSGRMASDCRWAGMRFARCNQHVPYCIIPRPLPCNRIMLPKSNGQLCPITMCNCLQEAFLLPFASERLTQATSVWLQAKVHNH
jgi:hypothetical protein